MGYTKEKLVDYLYQVADSYGIDRDIAYRQIDQESRFNPDACSPAGACGIAQFIPDTARRFGLTDRYDPVASLDAWGAYMCALLDQFGWRYDLALAGYNSGENRSEYRNAFAEERGINWAVMPAGVQTETRNYLKIILGDSDRPTMPPARRTPGAKERMMAGFKFSITRAVTALPPLRKAISFCWPSQESESC